MEFKSWLLLQEMGRARVPQGDSFTIPGLPDPQTGHRGNVSVGPDDIIDMRFEDWGQPFGDFSPWQVRLPDGRYFINHGMYNYEIARAPGKYKEVPQQGTSTEDGKTHPWYDFAEIVGGGNDVIKQPMYRRT